MITSLLGFIFFYQAHATTIDPFLPGPYQVDFTSIKPEIFGELDHHLDVFTPSSAGSFPVIVFFPGMATCHSLQHHPEAGGQLGVRGVGALGPPLQPCGHIQG